MVQCSIFISFIHAIRQFGCFGANGSVAQLTVEVCAATTCYNLKCECVTAFKT